MKTIPLSEVRSNLPRSNYFAPLKEEILKLKYDRAIVIECEQNDLARIISNYRTTINIWAKTQDFKVRLAKQSKTSFVIFKEKK